MILITHTQKRGQGNDNIFFSPGCYGVPMFIARTRVYLLQQMCNAVTLQAVILYYMITRYFIDSSRS